MVRTPTPRRQDGLPRARRDLRIDGDGLASYYSYDAAGRMIQRLEADNLAYYAYDAAGNRIMMQDGSGASYFSYDAVNRLTSEEGM